MRIIRIYCDASKEATAMLREKFCNDKKHNSLNPNFSNNLQMFNLYVWLYKYCNPNLPFIYNKSIEHSSAPQLHQMNLLDDFRIVKIHIYNTCDSFNYIFNRSGINLL